MNIFEINEGIRALLDNITVDEETGECVGDFEALDALSVDAVEKLESIGCYIKELKLSSDKMKQAADDINKRRKSVENHADRLEKYLSQSLAGYLQLTGAKNIETPNIKLAFRKSTRFVVTDEEKAFEAAKKNGFVVVEESIDKDKIKDFIKQGNAFDGAEFVDNQNLQIK